MNRRDFLKTTLTLAALAPLARLSAQTKEGIGKVSQGMIYRELGRSGLSVSAIALGVEGFKSRSFEETNTLVTYALKHDINFIDLCIADPRMLSDIARAMGAQRKQFVIQGHLGSIWRNGQYLRSRNLKACREAYENMLKTFGGHIEIGMIHYVDAEDDLDRICRNGLLAYAGDLKAAGRIDAIGLSSHSPAIARRAVEENLVDVLMFSINPGYDLRPSGRQIKYDEERQKLYELCARKNIGVDVMKAYGGGDLLNARLSPFGKAFTPVQALHYALTRPAVAAVMVGCRNVADIQAALAWCSASAAERDYTRVLDGLDAKSWQGHCLYCGHCAPCPKEIDIASVNKYLNLALAQGEVPPTVRDHYRLLKHHASECIQCGACEKRCPFSVPVRTKMKQAAGLFGI